MPIYEFKCKDCNNEFEILIMKQNLSKLKCSRCNSTNIERKISLNSFSLKGNGWSKDGYSKK